MQNEILSEEDEERLTYEKRIEEAEQAKRSELEALDKE